MRIRTSALTTNFSNLIAPVCLRFSFSQKYPFTFSRTPEA